MRQVPLGLMKRPYKKPSLTRGMIQRSTSPLPSGSTFLLYSLSHLCLLSKPQSPHLAMLHIGSQELMHIQYLAQGLAHKDAPYIPGPLILLLASSGFQARPWQLLSAAQRSKGSCPPQLPKDGHPWSSPVTGFSKDRQKAVL